MINILIADDHPIYRDGLITVLCDVDDINIVGEAANGLEVIQALKTKAIDIVLLDINMPIMNGIDCAKEISKNGFNAKIIILTQYNERILVKKLRNYISGYLLKDTDKNILVQVIRSVFYNNKCFFDPKLGGIHKGNHTDIFLNSFNITEREKEVMQLICKEKTSKEIAQILAISSNTVEIFRSRLLTKTGARNMAGLAVWAVENNLD